MYYIRYVVGICSFADLFSFPLSSGQVNTIFFWEPPYYSLSPFREGWSPLLDPRVRVWLTNQWEYNSTLYTVTGPDKSI